MEVKSCPNSEQHTGIETVYVSRSPTLLLRRAEANPDEIGSRGIDEIDYHTVFLGTELTERWRIATCHLQLRQLE